MFVSTTISACTTQFKSIQCLQQCQIQILCDYSLGTNKSICKSTARWGYQDFTVAPPEAKTWSFLFQLPQQQQALDCKVGQRG